ncbi:hypothetical protein CK556_02070 [Mesoplasma chauliocola]|uniref:Choline kinase n=1 Tax=Mesoplasma chauliocola TaxID=216427 RepID=A0A249SNF6_9MOLU|nr:phosphotransferase [Mesoplasma chauliocola]ASZ09142.1 hypothetical protein CK556_02070 [Mesoplasma chauliocola]
MKAISGLSNKIKVQKNDLIKESYSYVNKYLDRVNEIKIYEQLNDLNLSNFIFPYTWTYTNDELISKTHYFENAITLHDTDICKNKMKVVIKLIDEIHTLNLVGIKQFEPENFLNFFVNNTIKCLFDLSIYKEQINEIIKNYWNDSVKAVFSHNDLVKGNFINFKKGWKVIDFEYAMYNHYLFDYASFISESLNKKRWPVFIEMLNLSSQELLKLKDLITYQNYLWIYWASYMFEQTQENIFIEIAKEKYENMQKEINVR